MSGKVAKMVSGGQTGVDRAALDVAIELGCAHGGWVPQGHWAEDGPLASRYLVAEADSPQPAVRTELNVRDSGATLIISHGPLSGGSALTRELALRCARPVLHIDLAASDEATAAQQIRDWIDAHEIRVLNVAGPRASSDPLIYDAASRVLRRVLVG